MESKFFCWDVAKHEVHMAHCVEEKNFLDIIIDNWKIIRNDNIRWLVNMM